MATLKKTILGRLSGTVGDIVFRNKHGRNFVSSKPASFTAPSDEESLARRERFKLNIKFAAAVTSLSPLKEIWRAHKPARQTVQNFIIKENYQHISHIDVGNTALVVPATGFITEFDAINLSSSNLLVELTAIGEGAGIDPLVETTLRLSAIIFLSSPVDSSSPNYSFITVLSSPVPVNLQEGLVFNAPFSPVQTALFSQYQSAKPLCTIISFNAENKTVNFARTFTG